MKLKQKWIRLSPQERIYHVEIPVIAITGGIGTGKSSFSQLIKRDGFPLIDADQIIKEIYQVSSTIDFIQKLCPQVISQDKIDFKLLREIFFSTPKIKTKIEAFLFEQFPNFFLKQVKSFNSSFVFYDVPLLYEKKLENLCDVHAVVYAPKEMQIERVIQRDQTTPELALKIIEAQKSIEEKKSAAMLIIDNQGSLLDLENNYRQFIHLLFQD